MALPPPTPGSTALVTGASSGIGVEIARLLAARGHALVLVARRAKRLREHAAELAAEFGVPVEHEAADLGEPSGRDRVATRLGELELEVEVLINNAGFGHSGRVFDAERERLLEMVRLNCEGLLDLMARFTPGMVERGRGAVLNVASTAAFQPIPGTATYAATKTFVLSLTEASHEELKGKGVTATALCPGPVRTEFADVAGVGGAEESLPDPFWTPVEQVARQAVDGLENGKRVVIPGVLNRAGAVSAQHAPRAALLPLVRRVWRRGTKT